MGIDEISVFAIHFSNGFIGIFHRRKTAIEVLQTFADLVTDFILFLLFQSSHQATDLLTVIAGQMVQQTFQIAGDQNIHRRRIGQVKFSIDIVNTRIEEVRQDLVLIGCTDEFLHRNSHLAGVISRQDISKVSGRHHDINRIAGLDLTTFYQLCIAVYVVCHLRHQTTDVDGICRRKLASHGR